MRRPCDGPPGGDYEFPEWPGIPEWPDYDPWEDWEYDWDCVDWDEINAEALFFAINKVALTMNQGPGSYAGYCQVVDGKLTPVVNENNWEKLRDARNDGHDLTADILHESVDKHENNHIERAILRNPLLSGDYIPLVEGAYLGRLPSFEAEDEYYALQAQIKCIQDIIDDGVFKGRNLESDDTDRLEVAISQLEAKRDNYEYTPPSN
jgi:hypothetical protein